MFTEKELNILKALVEEESSISSQQKEEAIAEITGQYTHTLSDIIWKLCRMENAYGYDNLTNQRVSVHA